ncbi:MAG: S8 family peptidase [Candidatus Thorarchaeota archaeon]|nr:S8 family peptidase [Candidatus Thorarchaeota archaeon]
MYNYWEPGMSYTQPTSKSPMKGVALLVVFMLVLGTGIIVLFQMDGVFTPVPIGEVRVAVIDSGVDSTSALEGKIVAAASFIQTQYGYKSDDPTTTDSRPEGLGHGTLVATALVTSSVNAVVVSAKVTDSTGVALTPAIIAAIYWAVAVNCSVINLSLGSSPGVGDPLEDAVKYAFSQGVVVVCAAGNEGEDGVAGSSIASPSVFKHALSVGALDEVGLPAGYTSTGPTYWRSIKPDISTLGYVVVGSSKYYGTSFASPRAAAAVADIIAYCQANNITYTPGLVMAALMKSATAMNYPEYVVGAGRINTQGAIDLVAALPKTGQVGSLTYVRPLKLPLNFERLFYDDTYSFVVDIVDSGVSTIGISVASATPTVFSIPSSVTVNQTGSVELTVTVPHSGASQYSADITFTEGITTVGLLEVDFQVSSANARIAFDISHTLWSIDTVYGQFREYYKLLTQQGFSVTELRDPDAITASLLSQFYAVILLDPCSWALNETDPYHLTEFSIPFTPQQTSAYQNYYDSGGSLFVTALANSSVDLASLNNFLSWTGFEYHFNHIPYLGDYYLIDNIVSHPITQDVSDFDYNGASLSGPVGSVTLARYGSSPVLSCLQGVSGGRIVVTGTNFFIDNWGITGNYESLHDDDLALNIVLWLLGRI